MKVIGARIGYGVLLCLGLAMTIGSIRGGPLWLMLASLPTGHFLARFWRSFDHLPDEGETP